jgi:uncharacterized protein (DUF305 family)
MRHRKIVPLMFTAIGLLGSGLTACTPMNHAAKTDGKPMSGMDHSQMDHSKMDPNKMAGMNHQMDLGPADADYDLRFIDGMMPHHEGAIVMAQEVLQKSQRPELKQLATAMIKAQTAEIATMQKWRSAWYPKAPTTPMAWHAEMKHMMPMNDAQKQSMMMRMDLGAADADFDKRFLAAMVPHHEGAVTMAQDALKNSKRPEIQTMAAAILASQTKEIKQMQAWQQAWYPPK